MIKNTEEQAVIKRPKSAKKAKKVWFWAPECKYTVILNKVKSIDWKLINQEKNEAKCNLYWIDVATIGERFKTIQPWQTINHFPGNPDLGGKKNSH
jgi:hypothetical protein